MSEEYRVPKFRLAARLTAAGLPEREVVLHLSESAPQRLGRERPSDLLNGALLFLPVAEPDGRAWLLGRDSVLVLSVAAESEAGPEDAVGATEGVGHSECVEILLQGGRAIRGSVSYVLPPGRRRLLDFLNDSGDFLPVRDGDVIHLISKRRIVQVLPR